MILTLPGWHRWKILYSACWLAQMLLRLFPPLSVTSLSRMPHPPTFLATGPALWPSERRPALSSSGTFVHQFHQRWSHHRVCGAPQRLGWPRVRWVPPSLGCRFGRGHEGRRSPFSTASCACPWDSFQPRETRRRKNAVPELQAPRAQKLGQSTTRSTSGIRDAGSPVDHLALPS